MDKPTEASAANPRAMDYTATIMHELKTPLSAIIVSSELLEEELKFDEQSNTGRLLQSIVRNAHRLKERLSDLAKVTQWLVADVHLVPETIDIAQLVANVTTRIYPIFQGREQHLSLDVPASLPRLVADRQCLEQIVENLLANASNFTPNGGRIAVSAWRDGSGIVTRVSDTGVGIPKREWDNIFRPYYQLGRGSGKLAGSGLGLTIVRSLVEKQGGRVWLESEEQKGSSFYFSLPVDGNIYPEVGGK